MVLSVLLKLIYPPPPSIFITAMSVLGIVTLTNGGWMETKGKHMQYSKLLTQNEKKKPKVVPSKIGMLVLYTPAFLAGAASFLLLPLADDLRFTLVRAAVTTHFLKRILEVLFLHKFSGSVELEAMFTISLSYFSFSAISIYSQYLTLGLPEPAMDLKYIGVSLFLLGIGGNFYHHYLLTKLRTKDDKQYKIPQGGLFSLVICPHYLFEVIGFLGMSCISQTLYTSSFTLGTTFYLMGRSIATRKWYESKFEDFPQEVKALIPYIF